MFNRAEPFITDELGGKCEHNSKYTTCEQLKLYYLFKHLKKAYKIKIIFNRYIIISL